jgi:transposase
MLFEKGHKLFVGNPVLIRKRATSRHKSDRRDAELILNLLLKGEFPALWRRPPESNRVIDVLSLRRSLVRQRTQVYNRLQAMAHDVGLEKGSMDTAIFQGKIKAAPMDEDSSMRREHLFSLLEKFNEQIKQLSDWLKKKAAGDSSVSLLLTQTGVGYLTALVTVHTLGDVSRFPRIAKQVAGYAGLDPLEQTTGGKVRFGGVSKAGSSLLRCHIGQAAHIAARRDENLKCFYGRLVKRKMKAVAKTAVARKLLIKLAIMLRDKISAQEFDRRGRKVGNARVGQGLK